VSTIPPGAFGKGRAKMLVPGEEQNRAALLRHDESGQVIQTSRQGKGLALLPEHGEIEE